MQTENQTPSTFPSVSVVNTGWSAIANPASRHRPGRWLLNIAFYVCVILYMGGCESLGFPAKPKAEPPPVAPPIVVTPSAEPIIDPPAPDIQYAQACLKQLGYKIGAVDGIWGPRSAKAIRSFELSNGITSANGHLSELNLITLQQFSNLSRDSMPEIKPVTRVGLAAKIKTSLTNSQAPQLVIIDEPYTLLAKPNPFSATVATLQVGTGIYVLSLQEGWYEVESEDRVHGYIKAE